MKKVSLMMTTYNSMQNLKKTIASVQYQDYPNIEVLIADGGSKDGTLDVIKAFSQDPGQGIEVKWVSEKDKGLYDAMNKDIEMATGDYLLVFNDQFMDKSAISKLVSAIEQSGCDGAHADMIYADEKEVRRYWHMGEGSIGGGWAPAHPTLMLKREVYEKYGQYDISFRIAADYDFMIRILSGEATLVYVPEILVRMYYGGTSTSGARSYIDSLKEVYRALRKNKVRFALFIDFIRLFRVIGQFLMKRKADEVWSKFQKTI